MGLDCDISRVALSSVVGANIQSLRVLKLKCYNLCGGSHETARTGSASSLRGFNPGLLAIGRGSDSSGPSTFFKFNFPRRCPLLQIGFHRYKLACHLVFLQDAAVIP